MEEIQNFDVFKTMVGKQFPPTDWVTVTQEMINDFAKATLDNQWIHTDVERAKKESPFGETIAHGFLTASLLPDLLEKSVTIKSGRMGLNYGMNKMRFPHHVPAGSRVRGHVSVNNIEEFGGENGIRVTWDVVIELEGVKKPAVVAQMITLIFE